MRVEHIGTTCGGANMDRAVITLVNIVKIAPVTLIKGEPNTAKALNILAVLGLNIPTVPST
jgi:hypothetical protein